MKFYFISFLFSFIFLISTVLAHCPLCTAATGAAVAFTRWYGVDDSIVGVFVGGMVVATGLWINNMVKRHNKGKEYIPFQPVIVLIIFFILTIVTFYFAKLIGPPNPFKIFGIDRILFGTLIGIGVSFASFKLHEILRKFNRNRNFLPYQSIFIFILSLITSSLVLYLVM
ncbi:MAG: hypothetical protein QW818_02295 [Candidatus Aenigmatarchaeota archaeon]|nr:hypothetical protein [Candidatus Aenigmarchaeota archaeon]